MSLERKNNVRKKRRAQRVRWRFKKQSTLPRVSVFRSAKHIYAQLIVEGKTQVSYSTQELKDLKCDKKARAHQVGLELAKRAIDKGVEKIAFDRGCFLYHGRVKQLAEGLREGGLKF